jgi:hypothetical protein
MLVLGISIKGVGSAEIEIGGAGIEKGFCANLPPPYYASYSMYKFLAKGLSLLR